MFFLNGRIDYRNIADLEMKSEWFLCVSEPLWQKI